MALDLTKPSKHQHHHLQLPLAEKPVKKLTASERDYWQHRMPRGFQFYLERLARAVIRNHPKNTLEFAAIYLEELLVNRNAELHSLPMESFFAKLYKTKFSGSPWQPVRNRGGSDHHDCALTAGVLQPDLVVLEHLPVCTKLPIETSPSDCAQQGGLEELIPNLDETSTCCREPSENTSDPHQMCRVSGCPLPTAISLVCDDMGESSNAPSSSTCSNSSFNTAEDDSSPAMGPALFANRTRSVTSPCQNSEAAAAFTPGVECWDERDTKSKETETSGESTVVASGKESGISRSCMAEVGFLEVGNQLRCTSSLNHPLDYETRKASQKQLWPQGLATLDKEKYVLDDKASLRSAAPPQTENRKMEDLYIGMFSQVNQIEHQTKYFQNGSDRVVSRNQSWPRFDVPVRSCPEPASCISYCTTENHADRLFTDENDRSDTGCSLDEGTMKSESVQLTVDEADTPCQSEREQAVVVKVCDQMGGKLLSFKTQKNIPHLSQLGEGISGNKTPVKLSSGEKLNDCPSLSIDAIAASELTLKDCESRIYGGETAAQGCMLRESREDDSLECENARTFQESLGNALERELTLDDCSMRTVYCPEECKEETGCDDCDLAMSSADIEGLDDQSSEMVSEPNEEGVVDSEMNPQLKADLAKADLLKTFLNHAASPNLVTTFGEMDRKMDGSWEEQCAPKVPACQAQTHFDNDVAIYSDNKMNEEKVKTCRATEEQFLQSMESHITVGQPETTSGVVEMDTTNTSHPKDTADDIAMFNPFSDTENQVQISQAACERNLSGKAAATSRRPIMSFSSSSLEKNPGVCCDDDCTSLSGEMTSDLQPDSQGGDCELGKGGSTSDKKSLDLSHTESAAAPQPLPSVKPRDYTEPLSAESSNLEEENCVCDQDRVMVNEVKLNLESVVVGSCKILRVLDSCLTDDQPESTNKVIEEQTSAESKSADITPQHVPVGGMSVSGYEQIVSEPNTQTNKPTVTLDFFGEDEECLKEINFHSGNVKKYHDENEGLNLRDLSQTIQHFVDVAKRYSDGLEKVVTVVDGIVKKQSQRQKAEQIVSSGAKDRIAGPKMCTLPAGAIHCAMQKLETDELTGADYLQNAEHDAGIEDAMLVRGKGEEDYKIRCEFNETCRDSVMRTASLAGDEGIGTIPVREMLELKGSNTDSEIMNLEVVSVGSNSDQDCHGVICDPAFCSDGAVQEGRGSNDQEVIPVTNDGSDKAAAVTVNVADFDKYDKVKIDCNNNGNRLSHSEIESKSSIQNKSQTLENQQNLLSCEPPNSGSCMGKADAVATVKQTEVSQPNVLKVSVIDQKNSLSNHIYYQKGNMDLSGHGAQWRICPRRSDAPARKGKWKTEGGETDQKLTLSMEPDTHLRKSAVKLEQDSGKRAKIESCTSVRHRHLQDLKQRSSGATSKQQVQPAAAVRGKTGTSGKALGLGSGGGDNQRAVHSGNKELRRRDFPVRVRHGAKPDGLDDDVQDVTRRLTVEKPTENTLVHTTTTVDSNRRQSGHSTGYQLTSQRKRIYPGEREEFMRAEGTRTLVCETEFFTSHNPLTNSLVLENGTLKVNKSVRPPKSAKKKNIQKKKNDFETANGIDVGKNPLTAASHVDEKSLNWLQHGYVEIVGNTVMIGQSKNSSTTENTNLEDTHRAVLENTAASFDTGRLGTTQNNSNGCSIHYNEFDMVGPFLPPLTGGGEMETPKEIVNTAYGCCKKFRRHFRLKREEQKKALCCIWKRTGCESPKTSMKSFPWRIISECEPAAILGDLNNNSTQEEMKSDFDDTTLCDIDQITNEISQRSIDDINRKQRHQRKQRNALGKRDIEISYENAAYDSVKDINSEGCNVNERARGICRECEMPNPLKPGDGEEKAQEDIQTQVLATDIKASDMAQTGPSLRQRKSDLPPRCTERQRLKKGRKSVMCECDPPNDTGNGASRAADLEDFNVQVHPNDICRSDLTQTGPSIMDDGPSCPLDYKLRKTKYLKEDVYADCWCPRDDNLHPSETCLSFQAQVVATDIQSTDSVQTGPSLKDMPPFNTMEHKCAHRRKNYKLKELEDCECPDPSVIPEPGVMDCLPTQVKPTDICPSSLAQTGPSLTGEYPTLRGHRLRDIGAEDCRYPWEQSTKKRKLKENSIQVLPTDICPSSRIQTGSSLMLVEPFVRGESQIRHDGEVTKRGHRTNAEVEACICPRTEFLSHGENTEVCTQVLATDINPSLPAQTGDSLLLTKPFPRPKSLGIVSPDSSQRSDDITLYGQTPDLTMYEIAPKYAGHAGANFGNRTSNQLAQRSPCTADNCFESENEYLIHNVTIYPESENDFLVAIPEMGRVPFSQRTRHLKGSDDQLDLMTSAGVGGGGTEDPSLHR